MANKSSSSPYEPMPAPLPAPLPPSHPAPALETSGLQFCVTGSGATEEEIRHDYNNCFPLRLAKSVNIGLEMGNLLYKQRDQTYQVEMRYYNPDGFLMGTFERRDWIVKSDLDWAGIYTSEGIENSGSWIPGTYRVVVIIDGFEFAEGSFEIEETPPPSKDPPPIEKREPVKPTEQAEMGKASDLRIRLYGVQYLFFFESGKDCPEKELRSHRFWFPQETTRFINYEITLERIYSFRSDRTYQMVVRYYNPDGSLWRTDDPRDWVMKSDAREIVLTGGIGWEEPGRWKIGDYRIEFSINGEEFAQTKFKILKPRIKRSSNNGKTSGGKS